MNIGLDVGNSNSRAATFREKEKTAQLLTNSRAERVFPSLICLKPRNRLFGSAAKLAAPSESPAKLVNGVRRRLFDEDGPDAMVHYAMLIENLVSQVTRAQEPEVVVITVPLTANSHQRQAVKDLVRIALGNDVNVRIIHETTAAAVAYALENLQPGEGEDDVMVFSLGGGFLGVALVDIRSNSVTVKEAYGESVGGDDMTQAVTDELHRYIGDEFPEEAINVNLVKLRMEAETVKSRICRWNPTGVPIHIYNIVQDHDFKRVYRNEDFAEVTLEVFQKIRECLEKLKEPEAVKKILPVGGGSRSWGIESLLKEMFPHAIIARNINSEEAAVQGAAIIAHHVASNTLLHSLTSSDEKNFEVREVSTLSLCFDGDIVIPESERLPTKYYDLGKDGELSEGRMTKQFKRDSVRQVCIDEEGIITTQIDFTSHPAFEGLTSHDRALVSGELRRLHKEESEENQRILAKSCLEVHIYSLVDGAAKAEAIKWLKENEEASADVFDKKYAEMLSGESVGTGNSSNLNSQAPIQLPVTDFLRPTHSGKQRHDDRGVLPEDSAVRETPSVLKSTPVEVHSTETTVLSESGIGRMETSSTHTRTPEARRNNDALATVIKHGDASGLSSVSEHSTSLIRFGREDSGSTTAMKRPTPFANSGVVPRHFPDNRTEGHVETERPLVQNGHPCSPTKTRKPMTERSGSVHSDTQITSFQKPQVFNARKTRSASSPSNIHLSPVKSKQDKPLLPQSTSFSLPIPSQKQVRHSDKFTRPPRVTPSETPIRALLLEHRDQLRDAGIFLCYNRPAYRDTYKYVRDLLANDIYSNQERPSKHHWASCVQSSRHFLKRNRYRLLDVKGFSNVIDQLVECLPPRGRRFDHIDGRQPQTNQAKSHVQERHFRYSTEFLRAFHQLMPSRKANDIQTEYHRLRKQLDMAFDSFAPKPHSFFSACWPQRRRSNEFRHLSAPFILRNRKMLANGITRELVDSLALEFSQVELEYGCY
ncbi:unnamed protein product [Mesocestoides corti]|uniref:Heat shock protein 70 family n=1 Tax=Mesocestoides corti TaxID=53468 RepID=A0A0R3U780_MESCO|nr:unnamed protein product [Mesocestoides corti]